MFTAFVHACQLLCMKVIPEKELNEAEQQLIGFCIVFQALCGKKKCTSNVHIRGHLQKRFFDYAPVFSVCCFSFVRWNGMKL